MNMSEVIGIVVGLIKSIPTSAAGQAVAAAERAEAAAEVAEQHSIGMTVSGTKLVLTSPKE